MKIRVWCEHHNKPLDNLGDGGPYLVPDGSGFPVGWDDTSTPANGVWEVDLSDMGCTKEIESGENEEGTGFKDQCIATWTISVVPEQAAGD